MYEDVLREENISLSVIALKPCVHTVGLNQSTLKTTMVPLRTKLEARKELCKVANHYAPATLRESAGAASGEKEIIYINYTSLEAAKHSEDKQLHHGHARVALPLRKGFLQVKPPGTADPNSSSTFIITEEPPMCGSSCAAGASEAVQYVDLANLVVHKGQGEGAALRNVTTNVIHVLQPCTLLENVRETKAQQHVKGRSTLALIVPQEAPVDHKTFILVTLSKHVPSQEPNRKRIRGS